MTSESKYKFKLKTVQSNAIKTLVEGLKDIVEDVNIKINSEGMQFIRLDPTHAAIVNLCLVSKNFEQYECDYEFQIGISMKTLHILLKTVTSKDVITMYIEKDNSDSLHILIENNEKNIKDISSLKLLDINDDEIDIPPLEFDSVIKMPSNDFQKNCKDLANISDTIIINSYKDEIIMEAIGDNSEKKIIIGEAKNNVEFSKKSEENVNGKYDLKFLLLFIKCSNLCSVIDIFLKQNNPLILIYPVASLGSLRFLLSPKI